MLDFDARIAALLQWINHSANSYISPKIQVKHTAGSGRGLYTQSAVAANEKIVRILPLLLLNFTTATVHITSYNGEISLTDPHFHQIEAPPPVRDSVGEFYATLLLAQIELLLSFQLLSMFLVLERSRGVSSYWKPFIDMLPELSELDLAPVVWSVLDVADCDVLWHTLPRSARKHSELVVARFNRDYATVAEFVGPSGPKITKHDFLWAWMCINSRCLYMEMPQGKDSSDNFTMAPYVDFLNHLNNDQCGIKIDAAGFHVVTSCTYKAGEELYFSYGPHSNEFLLCEYGFTLPVNTWNYVDVSDMIIPLLRPPHVDFLKHSGYYGEYTVNGTGMSFRTEVALATLQEPNPAESRRIRAFVDGVSDGLVYSHKLKVLLTKIMEKLVGDCDRKLAQKSVYGADTERRVSAVLSLYRDIRVIAEGVIEEGEN